MEEACADAREHMCGCVPIPPRHLLQGSPNYSTKSDRNPNPVTQRRRRIPKRVYIENRTHCFSLVFPLAECVACQ